MTPSCLATGRSDYVHRNGARGRPRAALIAHYGLPPSDSPITGIVCCARAASGHIERGWLAPLFPLAHSSPALAELTSGLFAGSETCVPAFLRGSGRFLACWFCSAAASRSPGAVHWAADRRLVCCCLHTKRAQVLKQRCPVHLTMELIFTATTIIRLLRTSGHHQQAASPSAHTCSSTALCLRGEREGVWCLRPLQRICPSEDRSESPQRAVSS
jgi:hypothetical protein